MLNIAVEKHESDERQGNMILFEFLAGRLHESMDNNTKSMAKTTEVDSTRYASLREVGI